MSSLPDGCLVEPLGVYAGGDWMPLYVYRDKLGCKHALHPSDHNRLNILALFAGDQAILSQHWPRQGRNGTPLGWNVEDAAEALIVACIAKGALAEWPRD